MSAQAINKITQEKMDLTSWVQDMTKRIASEEKDALTITLLELEKKFQFLKTSGASYFQRFTKEERSDIQQQFESLYRSIETKALQVEIIADYHQTLLTLLVEKMQKQSYVEAGATYGAQGTPSVFMNDTKSLTVNQNA